MKRLPHIFQKISLYSIGISLIMLIVLFLGRMGVINCFGAISETLISIFNIVIYVAIFLFLISSEREENDDVKIIRAKVAARVFFAYVIILLCIKIIYALFISQDMSEILPTSLLTSGKAIFLFFLVYVIILKVAVNKNKVNKTLNNRV